jgi:predicted nucleic acid-binding protein
MENIRETEEELEVDENLMAEDKYLDFMDLTNAAHMQTKSLPIWMRHHKGSLNLIQF